MNPLHLLWIVPLSAFIGYIACALLSANGRDVRHGRWKMIYHDAYQQLADYECSVCSGILVDVIDDPEHGLNAYCPMCGSKMDLGDGNG